MSADIKLVKCECGRVSSQPATLTNAEKALLVVGNALREVARLVLTESDDHKIMAAASSAISKYNTTLKYLKEGK